MKDGTPLTGAHLNKVLKRCLSKHIPYEKGYYRIKCLIFFEFVWF